MRPNSLTPDHPISLGLLFVFKLIVYLIGAVLVITGLLFLSGQNIPDNVFILPVSLAGVVFAVALEFRNVYRVPVAGVVAYLVISLSILTLSTLISGWIYDKSWDGMGYHQIGILEMSNGWNPFYEQLPMDVKESKYFDRPINLNLWVNHYSKALETFSAVVMNITGNIESGKVFNILMLLAAFCSTLYLFIKLNLFSTAWNVIIAFAAAFNPITVNQLFSYYLDGAIGSAILILVSQLLVMFLEEDRRTRWTGYISIFFTAVILVNLKFTGLLHLACIAFAFLLLAIYSKRSHLLKTFCVTMFISGLVAVGVAGFNPYVTNTIHYGHPFHPIAGENKVDVLLHMMPDALKDHNRIGKFFLSTYSRCDNFSNQNEKKLEYKLPFTFSASEAKVLQSEGIRLGGFGVLWSGIFTLTVIFGFLIAVKLRGKGRIYFLVFILGILTSVAMNPAAWWARFVPQLWLFPVIVLVFMLVTQKHLVFQIAGKVLILTMILNSVVIAASYSYSVFKITRSANSIFTELRKTSAPVYVYFDIFTPNIKKFEANNIPYVKVSRFEDLKCDSPSSILKMDFCKQPGEMKVPVYE